MLQYRLFRMLAMLWVGCLLTISYLVVPYLFRFLPKEAAGEIATHLFAFEALWGIVVAILLTILSFYFHTERKVYARLRKWIYVMGLCTLLGYYIPVHFMNEWHLALAQDVSNAMYASRFALVHTIASVFYLIKSIVGLVLIWRMPSHFEEQFYIWRK